MSSTSASAGGLDAVSQLNSFHEAFNALDIATMPAESLREQVVKYFKLAMRQTERQVELFERLQGAKEYKPYPTGGHLSGRSAASTENLYKSVAPSQQSTFSEHAQPRWNPDKESQLSASLLRANTLQEELTNATQKIASLQSRLVLSMDEVHNLEEARVQEQYDALLASRLLQGRVREAEMQRDSLLDAGQSLIDEQYAEELERLEGLMTRWAPEPSDLGEDQEA